MKRLKLSPSHDSGFVINELVIASLCWLLKIVVSVHFQLGSFILQWSTKGPPRLGCCLLKRNVNTCKRWSQKMGRTRTISQSLVARLQQWRKSFDERVKNMHASTHCSAPWIKVAQFAQAWRMSETLDVLVCTGYFEPRALSSLGLGKISSFVLYL